MGANHSSELDTQRIAEIATEANGQFAKEYSIAFEDAVISKIKNAYLQGNNKSALLQAEVPSQNIKSGYLLKIGANVKNWKRRKFVAKNKADNYSILYFEDEQEAKEKGKISCCGYEVDTFSPEETSWYGLYGIKLKSHDETKRQWLFRAENEEDQNQWIEVFMNACKKSIPDQQRDPVFTEAFKTAYRITRAAYGYFGIFHIIGTECEMLEYLSNQILSREMLDDYIVSKARTNSVAKKNLMISLHNNVQKIVRPIVQSTWRSCFSSVEVMKASFELSVKASLRVLLEKETEIKTFLTPKIRVLVDPFISELQTKTCVPILKCCFEDIVEAYEQALLGFHRELRKIMGSIEFYPDTMNKEMLRMEELIEQVNAGPLSSSQKILWKMHTNDLVDVYELFELSGVSGYDLYITMMDDLKSLLQNALHTFNKLCNPNSSKALNTLASTLQSNSVDNTNNSNNNALQLSRDSSNSFVPISNSSNGTTTGKRSMLEILNEVISKLTIDAKSTLQKGLVTFLNNAIEFKVQELMIAPCYEVGLSAQHLVTRDTQLMINLNSISECMVRDMVNQCIVSILDDPIAEASSRLNMVAVQLIGETDQK